MEFLRLKETEVELDSQGTRLVSTQLEYLVVLYCKDFSCYICSNNFISYLVLVHNNHFSRIFAK